MTSRKLFVNLMVKDLRRSTAFFRALGFDFNDRFTDDSAACMVISDQAWVMLVTEPHFATFSKRTPCDTRTHTEALLAVSCESREEVDELVKKAVAKGGSHAMEPQDHGHMYGWSFYDLDGHHWEVMWMDPEATR